MKIIEFINVFEALGDESWASTTLYQYIGEKFLFKAEWGSHNEVIIGTITGFGNSDEGGPKIYVSNRTFDGLGLESIYLNVDKKHWGARCITKNEGLKNISGILIIRGKVIQ